jgi:hypothetical protein
MVHMLRRSHWTLYVINFQLRRIDILDSNPYGPLLGGTSQKQIHNDQNLVYQSLATTRLGFFPIVQPCYQGQMIVVFCRKLLPMLQF